MIQDRNIYTYWLLKNNLLVKGDEEAVLQQFMVESVALLE
jgi:hypothetical protein